MLVNQKNAGFVYSGDINVENWVLVCIGKAKKKKAGYKVQPYICRWFIG